ncbi:2Fe-2S iron-sulfur cluster-binding protein [Oceanibacterium hippocampi]|uniref:Ferredoxin--NAD(P)(+) reductase (Naphthalene dioxygenase/salicylate 5-hydroxylase ferredoxin-specific) n=1 Tax=Oceanibacterium hippocampi TaxID=745714 RepID=A0A1Y5RG18_9PROT|nr:2Fe-2S iron-sulfur cluster-binding protein [Oceanibacterium hippocampi]SLN16442.1 Ferredoxin--NAD(P)(+) reductase (naphthalene dioxygenase/salicylate 5-hydroxylase ferredoxin-specific) [Oceanibacterium hippocampi]
MSYRVRIRQSETPLEVAMGQTILEAALEAGISYPCGCRSGNCGACKSRLFEGDVEMSPHSPYALSKEERKAGFILACRSVPWSDCDVAWNEPDELPQHPLRRLTCRVCGLDALTHDIRRVRLEIVEGGPFDFSAGQYASLAFNGHPPRDYSMAGAPGDEVLEFHVRAVEGGGVSAFVARELAPGDRVIVEGPHGIAQLREGHRGPILALAGGSGLAPIRSIVRRALDLGFAQPIHCYLGVRDERDVYGEAEFRALAEQHGNFSFTVVLSEPSAPTERRTGYLADIVASDFANLDGAKAYLAGPPVMVETCVRKLEAAGLAPEDCHADAFYTEAEKQALEAANG